MTELNLHQLTGAYALDALDEDEVALFAAHLDECESCLAECAGLAQTVVRLADLVAWGGGLRTCRDHGCS